MTKELSNEHKLQLEDLKRRLTSISAKESNFLKVELIFYETIEVARHYGDDPKENGLLDALKQLQSHQYQDTKAYFKKSSQREQVIRQFISKLKTVLSAGIKNSYLTTPTQS